MAPDPPESILAQRAPKRQRLVPESSRPAYPRKRAAQACLTCRRRRTKCDNERPCCASCSQLGIECVYQEADKSSFDSASLAILQRLDGLEDFLRASLPVNSGHHRTDAAPDADHSLPEDQQLRPGSAGDFAPATALAETDVLPEICCINVEAVLVWPSLGLDTTAWTGQARLKALLQAGKPDAGPRLLAASDIEADDAGSLLQRFLDHFHVYNPVLEVERIKESVRYTLYNSLGWDAKSCLILLIYALGSIAGHDRVYETSAAFRQSEQFLRGEAFFLAAQRRMGLLLCSSGIIEAQNFFLAGVYLMTTMRPVEAWKMFVQALACCQGFVPSSDVEGGTDPTLGDDGSHGRQSESQLYKSIYWTCFKSELELRLELSITETSAWNLRYPTFFPEPPTILQSQSEAAWYFYLAEIALCRLKNRVMTSMCQPRPEGQHSRGRISSIVDFEQQADSWLHSLPDTLNPARATDEDQDDVAPDAEKHAALRFILNGHLLDCYEMMYWPLMAEAVQGGLNDDDESRMLARKGFRICVRRIEENVRGFRYRHHGAWLMLRSCTRSALVLIAAARSNSTVHAMLPPGWETSVGKVMQMLSYWKDETEDAADRLRILEQLMLAHS